MENISRREITTAGLVVLGAGCIGFGPSNGYKCNSGVDKHFESDQLSITNISVSNPIITISIDIENESVEAFELITEDGDVVSSVSVESDTDDVTIEWEPEDEPEDLVLTIDALSTEETIDSARVTVDCERS